MNIDKNAENKQKIIDLFTNNVKGKEIELNENHCGSEGHWLETKMCISHNSKNEPDIFGYEMKKNSKKITFGDFSASEYLFLKKKPEILEINKMEPTTITRIEFIKYFGNPNVEKDNRHSWSGSCVPTYGSWNLCGQKMGFAENNDLHILYSFEKDERERKKDFPEFLKRNELVIAIWKFDKLQKHINRKFNDKGFFICKKTKNVYDKICFGKPFDINCFIENVKNKVIFFDSGMYDGNNRNYSQFRSSANNFWNKLIVEEY